MENDSNVLNVYMYGSRVYRSHDADSDNDYILVTKAPQTPRTVNEHCYTVEEFQALLDNHSIPALECLFLPSAFTIQIKQGFNFELDLTKLRVAVSTIASHSFVKGKKKITVLQDYDLRAGIKSVFHSLRILDFGIQIALHGYIHDYSSMNWVLTDLWSMTKEASYDALWQRINTKYKPLYNKKASEFKALCPKDIQERNRLKEVKNILKIYGIAHEDYPGLAEELSH